jgi:tetratricopeptide (TPR) repeat protein
MRTIAVLFVAFIGLSGLPGAPSSAAHADEREALFSAANQKYFAGDWEGAARAYAELVERFELDNAALYHNLGNAYFRSGAYGSAILYYRRAQMLEPERALSEALARNLDAARRTLQARYRASSDSALVFASPADALYLVTHVFDEALLAFGFLFAWTALFALLVLRRIKADARWPGRLAIAAGLVALLAGLLTWGRVISETQNRLGVVVSADALLRDGRHEVAQGQKLPEGIEVRIVEGDGPWLQVELGSGRRGWVSASDVKQI